MGSLQLGSYDVEVHAGEQTASFRGQGKQLGRDQSAVDRRRIVGERLERGDEPGLLEPVAGL